MSARGGGRTIKLPGLIFNERCVWTSPGDARLCFWKGGSGKMELWLVPEKGGDVEWISARGGEVGVKFQEFVFVESRWIKQQ
jgi:hypothetical protein